MRFDEIWIGENQLRYLSYLLRTTASLPGEVVEVGVWQGLSTITLMNTCAPANVHAVDHWLGDNNPEGIDRERAASRDNYQIFLDNVAEATMGNVIIHKMDWREFAHEFKEPIRFLHIDATHTAEEVSDNIRALLPLAVDGAIFAGDDFTSWPGVAEGVRRVFGADNFCAAGDLWWKVL
jgi:hypothetical protein